MISQHNDHHDPWDDGALSLVSCEDPITTGIHSNTPDNNSYKLQTSWYYPDRVSDTAWHCMLTMLFSRDELFAFSMHINCNASVLQGIIVVIVSRQCFSPPAVFAFLMNISQPPPDIIVQSLGPRLACALSHCSLHPLVIRSPAVESGVMTRGRGQGQTQADTGA